MLLSNDTETFRLLIENASRDLRIAQLFIEKDFYAISILKELINRDNNFVFKGGTSLSVCQRLINRFSEDIDISYAVDHITTSQKRKIKQIFFDSIEASSLSVSNPEDIRSRRVFNRYLCPYKSIFNEMGDKVIVEWSIKTTSYPIEEKVAQTIIGRYLESIKRNDLIEKYELGPFVVKTICKERTLVDKIFAICDYHIYKKLERQSRHIYDIFHLLKYVALDEQFITLFKSVKQDRIPLINTPSASGDTPVSVILYDLIKEETFKPDYLKMTTILIYDQIKYDDCISSILRIADFLKQNNL